ncbi:MAG: gamma-glutamyltransferase family protein [Pigmentiphaga sp.]|uniref:gamma-glutamyltransferase family protein n=1 Tax=Pigmentiphaga sp. TaxID=1977564 RepID=UPI0029B489D1|nr:gamma-glutamyltransferase family protein [Pigmentiphaga sp.]MDX3906608.1 gamma-glutamyltransferase family protein [Pigmentiphaga sp.]
MLPFDWKFPYPSQKMPLLAANAVSTSQPLAAQAGLRMLYDGGNAVDAALATAIALTVLEPVMNGIGGDLFAIVWHEGRLHGINSSGRSPAAWTLDRFRGRTTMPVTGWDAVTVPGQVAGWRALSERFGKLPFERLFEPALGYARQGFQVTPQIARLWEQQAPALAGEPGFAQAFFRDGTTPRAGDRWRFPEQADTLADIARTGGESFYRGALAQRIVDFAQQTGGALALADLAAHEAQWVEPLSQDFRGYTVHEIPPSGQGIAALAALGMLDRLDLEGMGLDSPAMYHAMIEAMKLAFSDLHEHIADPAAMRVAPADLLAPDYLARRAALIDPARAGAPAAGTPKLGGTVYLAAADADGTMVSFIQSNFQGFGSGVVVPGTGISLHNRGIGFNLRPGHVNCVGPSKKPLHTIIPGFVTRDGQPVMAFGVMGGTMQAQGHVQMMVRLGAFGQNPQAMSDAPRFRVDDGMVRLEAHTPAAVVEQLRGLGHTVEVSEPQSLDFGSAQLIYRSDDGYIAASDSRRDGQAVGY